MPVDPAKLHIVHYPASVLRQKAQPVKEVSAEVRAVAARMIQLMHEAEGIGLAAPQVGLPWRLFVAHVPHSDDPEDARSLHTDPVSATREPVVYINPVLSQPQRDLEPWDEGCLSLPDIRGEVRRPSAITITALGLNAEPFTLRASGLLARCWQHEIDHLDGVLILDRMTQISKMKNKQAVANLEREARYL
jgi:peptide deformylase